MTGMLMVRRQARRSNEIGLFPVDEVSFDELMKVPSEKTSLVSAKAPRNPRHHALAWALAAKLAEACDWLHDAEDAMTYLKVRARHVTWVTNPITGEAIARPKSIAFGSLDQVHFARVFDRFIWIITNELLPGIEEGALRAEILKMVEGIKNTPQSATEEPHQDQTNDYQNTRQDTLESRPDEAGMGNEASGPTTGQDGAKPSTESNLSEPAPGQDGRAESGSDAPLAMLSADDRRFLGQYAAALRPGRSPKELAGMREAFAKANPGRGFPENHVGRAVGQSIYAIEAKRAVGELSVEDADARIEGLLT